MQPPVTVESLDQEGRGVAHVDGKVIFIEGALPGEPLPKPEGIGGPRTD